MRYIKVQYGIFNFITMTTQEESFEDKENQEYFEAIEKSQVAPIIPEINEQYWIRIGYPYNSDTVHKATCLARNTDTGIAVFKIRFRRTQLFTSKIELYFSNIVAEV